MKANNSTLPFSGLDPTPRRFGSRTFYAVVAIPIVLFTFSYGLRRLEYAITFHPERFSADHCVFCFGGDKYLDEIAAFARAAVAKE